jgi:hypothetical protein
MAGIYLDFEKGGGYNEGRFRGRERILGTEERNE